MGLRCPSLVAAIGGATDEEDFSGEGDGEDDMRRVKDRGASSALYGCRGRYKTCEIGAWVRVIVLYQQKIGIHYAELEIKI